MGLARAILSEEFIVSHSFRFKMSVYVMLIMAPHPCGDTEMTHRHEDAGMIYRIEVNRP